MIESLHLSARTRRQVAVLTVVLVLSIGYAPALMSTKIAYADSANVSIPLGASAFGSDAFFPNPAEIEIGGTLTWTNDDTVPHTVTSGTDGIPDGKFDSSPNFDPLILPHESFSNTFEEAGLYPYFCQLHPSMVGLVEVTSHSVIATIPVGFDPRGIAFNPANGNVYVANVQDGSVTVIDGDTNTVIDTIEVGVAPVDIAVNSENGNLYVVDFDKVFGVDSTVNEVIGEPIPVPESHFSIAFNPDNGDMYVPNLNDNTVSVIDTGNNEVVATVPVGNFPQDLTFNPDNGDMYVSNGNDNTVSVIDGATNSVVDTISVGSCPFGIAFNPENRNLYVANGCDSSISIVDSISNSVVQDPIPVSDFPIAITHNTVSGMIYVVQFDNTVSVVDPIANVVVETLTVGNIPWGIAFNPNNGNLYVTNANDNTVSVISASIPEPPPTPTVQTLIDEISGLNLPHGVQASLTAPIKEAQNLIADDNPSNDRAVCAKFDSFTNKVIAKQKEGQLTADNALELRHLAQEIKDSLGC